jgi:hypothetical protein
MWVRVFVWGRTERVSMYVYVGVWFVQTYSLRTAQRCTELATEVVHFIQTEIVQELQA